MLKSKNYNFHMAKLLFGLYTRRLKHVAVREENKNVGAYLTICHRYHGHLFVCQLYRDNYKFAENQEPTYNFAIFADVACHITAPP